MPNPEDTRLTLSCPSREVRDQLLDTLYSTGSVKVFPHLTEAELAARRLASNTARSFGVRVVPRGLRCGFAPLGGQPPQGLKTFALNRPTAELASSFRKACEALQFNQRPSRALPRAYSPPHPPLASHHAHPSHLPEYPVPAPSLRTPPGFPGPSYA